MVVHAIFLVNQADDLEYLRPFVCFIAVEVCTQVLLVTETGALPVLVNANEAFNSFRSDNAFFEISFDIVIYGWRYLGLFNLFFRFS